MVAAAAAANVTITTVVNRWRTVWPLPPLVVVVVDALARAAALESAENRFIS